MKQNLRVKSNSVDLKSNQRLKVSASQSQPALLSKHPSKAHLGQQPPDTKQTVQ